MKNVLHIMDFAAPYKGNFIASIECLEKHMNIKGGKLIYMFPEITSKLDWCLSLRNQGKIIYFIESSFFSKRITYHNVKTILNIIKKQKISVIHTNFVECNFTLFLIKKIIPGKLKVVGQFQNHYIPVENILKKIKFYVTKNTFDKIIGVSESVVQSIINSGIESRKVMCVNNSLATERLEKYIYLNISDQEDQKVVLMFGWPFERKGVDIAIESVKQLNEEGANLLLAISLSGGQSIIEDKIRNQLGSLPKWIKLLNPREDVASYYNAADIFLSSSREEGYTFAVLEAAYCNTMLIVSNIGGNPQDIPYTGIYNFDDITQLKILITKMIQIPEIELKKIRVAQKEYVTQTYDLDNWANSIITAYN